MLSGKIDHFIQSCLPIKFLVIYFSMVVILFFYTRNKHVFFREFNYYMSTVIRLSADMVTSRNFVSGAECMANHNNVVGYDPSDYS